MVEAMHFTLSQHPDYDELIQSKLNDIVRQILDVIQPPTILLYGSLGRGEGTVINNPETGIKILSDFEIGIVSGNITDFRYLKELRRKINSGNDVEVTLSFFLPTRFTHKISSNWSLFESKRVTLEQYDLVEGMRVLHGSDPRSQSLNLAASNIFPWDALRLIFNRSAELIISKHNPIKFAEDSDKPINKLLIACGDAVLLLSGNYHCSYALRREVIRENFKKESKKMYSDVDWDMVLSGYNWKLNVSSSKFPPVRLEDIFANVYVPVLRYCTSEIFGWTFDSLDDFGNRYLDEKNLKYCSRLYPGQPLLQDGMLLIRSSLQHIINLKLLTSKQAHGVFVEIVKHTEKLLNPIHQSTSPIYSNTDVQKLISKWEIVSSVL